MKSVCPIATCIYAKTTTIPYIGKIYSQSWFKVHELDTYIHTYIHTCTCLLHQKYPVLAPVMSSLCVAMTCDCNRDFLCTDDRVSTIFHMSTFPIVLRLINVRNNTLTTSGMRSHVCALTTPKGELVDQ